MRTLTTREAARILHYPQEYVRLSEVLPQYMVLRAFVPLGRRDAELWSVIREAVTNELPSVSDVIEARRHKKRRRSPGTAPAKVSRSPVVRRQTPPWADMGKIKEIYAACEQRNKLHPRQWHVDHIIPLQGERISGLHVPENLRIVLARTNLKKHNKFHGDPV